MKVRVFGEGSMELILKLIQNGDSVQLVAVDADGCTVNDGRILSVEPSGRIRMSKNASCSLGLQRNHEGQVVVDY